MIKSIFLTVLVCHQLFGQAYIDKDVEKVASYYVDTLMREKRHLPPNLYLIVKTLETKTGRRVYVTSSEKLHDLLSEGIPNAYIKSNDRWIFMFASRVDTPDNKTLKSKFLTDFSEQLNKEDTLSISGFHPISFMYLLSGGKVLKARKICGFPFSSFLHQGKTFDEEGNLMYKDGVYDLCNLEIQGSLSSKPPLVLVRENTFDSLSSKSLGAELIIDESGKVESVRLNGEDIGTLSESTKSEIIKLLRNMPSWGKGSISGRPVKYRIFVAL